MLEMRVTAENAGDAEKRGGGLVLGLKIKYIFKTN
jgi:hypothetical protein